MEDAQTSPKVPVVGAATLTDMKPGALAGQCDTICRLGPGTGKGGGGEEVRQASLRKATEPVALGFNVFVTGRDLAHRLDRQETAHAVAVEDTGTGSLALILPTRSASSLNEIRSAKAGHQRRKRSRRKLTKRDQATYEPVRGDPFGMFSGMTFRRLTLHTPISRR